MRTWASCHRDLRAGGFTLLEVLVVLVIISMAVAVIGPRLQKTYDAVVSSGERREVIRQIERLPMLAREKRGLSFVAGSDEMNTTLQLPEGWRVFPVGVLVVESSGACRPAKLRLQKQAEGATELVDLRSPDCRVSGP